MIDLSNEAPNVVTEPRFRDLVASGYRVEVVCKEDAYKKGPTHLTQRHQDPRDQDRHRRALLPARCRLLTRGHSTLGRQADSAQAFERRDYGQPGLAPFSSAF